MIARQKTILLETCPKSASNFDSNITIVWEAARMFDERVLDMDFSINNLDIVTDELKFCLLLQSKKVVCFRTFSLLSTLLTLGALPWRNQE